MLAVWDPRSFNPGRARRRPGAGSEGAVRVNVHRLRLFCAVAKAGSLAAAAQRLFISEAAVSHQIKSLEQELGTRLFDRRARGVRLTPAGEAVYRQAGVALDAMERLLAVAQQREEGPQSVVVGVTRLGGLYHLTETFRDFRRRQPKIGLDVIEIPSEEICARMSRGEMGVGFVWEPVSGRLPLEQLRFSEDQAVLVTAASPPPAEGSPAGPLVVVRTGEGDSSPCCCCGDEVERLVPARDRERQVRPVASVDTAKKLAEAGLAVAVLPARTVVMEVRAGLLTAAGTQSPPLHLTMIYPPATARTPAQRALIEFILARSEPCSARVATPASS